MTTSIPVSLDMKYLVRALLKYKASDLHIKVGRPPLFRIGGKIIAAKMKTLTAEEINRILGEILTQKQHAELQSRKQLDLSFSVPLIGRFRCNVFFQKGTPSAAVRMIPLSIPTLQELSLPPIIRDLCQRPSGLILITGATGSGKSTTLASMVQHINQNNHAHIVTLEDPIEFIHQDAKSTISQREIGSDVNSMNEGLIASLRQDPDVIMLGEIRDLETIKTALTAAETGHLVLTTLHTNDAIGSIHRILDVFQNEGQNQIRVQLASSLIAIFSQQLVSKSDGTGLIPACEVMINSPTIESYIRKNELDLIPETIANSNGYYQMQSMNQSLEKLVSKGLVQIEEAMKYSKSPEDLKLMLSGIEKK